MLTLAAAHVLMVAVWLGGVGLSLGAVTRRNGIDRLLDYVQQAGALLLVGLGVRTLLNVGHARL